MVQLLLILLAFTIIVSGIHGFAFGFLRNSGDYTQALRQYRGRLFRQTIIGLIAAVAIGLAAPSVWVVLLVAVVASALVARYV